jgi:lipoprotein-anchoring transpeptidase ErfK/SrfK
MCADRRAVYDTAITSGIVGEWTSTPIGHYVVQDRVRHTVLTLNTGAQYRVKYWIPFDGPLFGFHDSSWQAFPYGSPAYKTRGSHGCIHLPLAAMRFLYRWASAPTEVYIA